MKMKCKKILAAALALCLAVLATACGADNSQEGQQAANETPSGQEQGSTSADTATAGDDGGSYDAEKADNLPETREEDVTGTLPSYEYPGPELFYFVLYQYMADNLVEVVSENEASIPCPVIVAVDEGDPGDIKVYGDFWVFNYYLDGEIMKSTSGGSYPGCIHVRSTDDGYEVIGMDRVGDGSQFEPTAREIFGQYYDEFSKVSGDEAKREEIRAQVIANYVAANGLDVSAYQDEGWDPVSLPEENIDSFYSDLN